MGWSGLLIKGTIQKQVLLKNAYYKLFIAHQQCSLIENKRSINHYSNVVN